MTKKCSKRECRKDDKERKNKQRNKTIWKRASREEGRKDEKGGENKGRGRMEVTKGKGRGRGGVK